EMGGQSRYNMAALDPGSGAASGWDPTTNNVVYSVAARGGFIYAGGSFNFIHGLPHSTLAGMSQGITAVNEPIVDVGRGELRASPNPFHTGATLRLVLPQAEVADVA